MLYGIIYATIIILALRYAINALGLMGKYGATFLISASVLSLLFIIFLEIHSNMKISANRDARITNDKEVCERNLKQGNDPGSVCNPYKALLCSAGEIPLVSVEIICKK